MDVVREIDYLRDLMPASARMSIKLIAKADRNVTIEAPLPSPWQKKRKVYLNLRHWERLPRAERDLLLLSAVNQVLDIRWFQLDVYRGAALAGTLATIVEGIQGNPLGIVAAGTLTAFAARQVWRRNQSSDRDLRADEAAVSIAQRRGYGTETAALALVSAIEHAAELEGRRSLELTEVLRCQHLRAIARASGQ